jgi:hypothetical protein
MSKQKYDPTGGTPKKRGEFSGTPRGSEQHPADVGHDLVDSAIYPLSLWRTLRAAEFEAPSLVAIRSLLAKTVLFGQPKWPAAVAGDTAAAIAVAASFMPIDNVTFQVDLAMTALIRCAVEGDLAAAIVVANILRHLPGCSPSHRQIATSWFVSNLLVASRGTRQCKSETFSDAPRPEITPNAAKKSRRRNHIKRVLQFQENQESES